MFFLYDFKYRWANAIDYCLITLIFYLGMRSAHSVYHLDADEDEAEWSE